MTHSRSSPPPPSLLITPLRSYDPLQVNITPHHPHHQSNITQSPPFHYHLIQVHSHLHLQLLLQPFRSGVSVCEGMNVCLLSLCIVSVTDYMRAFNCLYTPDESLQWAETRRVSLWSATTVIYHRLGRPTLSLRHTSTLPSSVLDLLFK